LKKTVLKFRSNNNIVIAPAKTGRDKSRRTAVIKTDQANNGREYISIPNARILIIVMIKFIAPKMEDAPARCRLKIPKSTAGPECASISLSGG
jgi:hypothetical protein